MAFSTSREDFVRFCSLLYHRDLVAGVGGNVAARDRDVVLVTPTSHSLRALEPEDVVAVDSEGRPVGEGQPSKEIGMHLAVLREHPDAGAVIHIHGSYVIAASCMLEPGQDSLPALTPGFTCFAYPMPMVPFAVPGSPELLEWVGEACRGGRAVLLQNHGLVTWGRDLTEALDVAEEVDEAAQVFVLSQGRASVIPERLRAAIF